MSTSTTSAARRASAMPNRRSLRDEVAADLNIIAGGLLQDLAVLQGPARSGFGYKRAAKALASGIDDSVGDLIERGTLREIPYVGKSTERIVTELVRTGASETVDR